MFNSIAQRPVTATSLLMATTVGLTAAVGLVAGATAAAAPAAVAASTVAGDPPLPAYPGLPAGPSTLAAVSTTPIPCESNGSDKSPTRSEVLTRARSWLSVGIPYSQERCYRNQYGDYRTDCSGFVSMAWGLGGSGSAFWTGNLLNRSHTIARSDLKPGDALLRHTGDTSENHVALFVAWSDSAHTKPTVMEQTGSRDTVEDVWSASYSSQYTPIRYDNITDIAGSANVYGVLPDGRLTFSTIDAATGNRTKTLISSTTVGFTPKAMATLNFNTVLMTDTAGYLYRIDVITNNTSLGYNPPVRIATGWTHELLTYDGNTHLFGIRNGDLRRYTVSATKPTDATIGAGQLIGNGFFLNTLAATSSNWLVGTTPAGALRSYKLDSAGTWEGHSLATDHWFFDAFLSPGDGVYYGRTTGDGLYRYLDNDPYDDTGSDIQSFPNGPVDTTGWTQTLLSAQPGTVTG
ncbi:NlpC/P60 family protein [Micromonospora rifamycinica]|uniref:NlpC/P60 domain-containing protein n=1 Tax=Micromonospora rifamycinica TaxID=291594 RepID=A0A1C5KGQ7_9ACTN|nr:hypothetical protein [Micromonospora rifamycinica]SCG81606.1 hypothetical protein GA0070623_5992 [Micromonospora rifamycinica]